MAFETTNGHGPSNLMLIPIKHEGNMTVLPGTATLSKYRETTETIETRSDDPELCDDEILNKEWDEFVEDFPHCEQYLDVQYLNQQFPSFRRRIQDSNTMVVTEDDQRPQQNGNITFEVNVSGYRPEEIAVRATGHTVKVLAKKQDRFEENHNQEQVQSEFRLPDGVPIEKLKTHLSPDMKLTISLPRGITENGCAHCNDPQLCIER